MSAALSNDLSEWNFATIRILVHDHVYEAGIFDFKEVLNATADQGRDRHNESIVRTACSMANSDGGFLIFGVKDGQSGDPPDERIVGIPLNSEHRADFGRKIHDIQPPLYFDALPAPVRLPSDPEKGVFVVHIPKSPRRPHMVRSKGVFYRRGEGASSEPMDYYQVRDQLLLSEERLQQVALVRLRILQWQQLCVDLLRRDAAALIDHHGRFETTGFESQLSTVCAVLPGDLELLKKLLALPMDAQMLNRTLERWHFDDFQGHRIRSRAQPEFEAWQHDIHRKAEVLAESCEEAETTLKLHFDEIVRTASPELAIPQPVDEGKLAVSK